MENEVIDPMKDIELRLKRPRVEQEYLSIKEAKAYTGLSDDHIRRAVTGGTLPASNVGTPDRALYRLKKANIDAWMREREAGPKPAPRKKVEVAVAKTAKRSRGEAGRA